MWKISRQNDDDDDEEVEEEEGVMMIMMMMMMMMIMTCVPGNKEKLAPDCPDVGILFCAATYIRVLPVARDLTKL